MIGIQTGIIFVLLAFLFVALRFAWRMSKVVMAVENAVEDSLDELEEVYGRISQILEKPIFFDSLEVRQVISDISKSREVILYVANSLTRSVDPGAVSDSDRDEGDERE